VKASDLPTFYFDYFLDVEDANSTLQNRNMLDSARVFIGPFTSTTTLATALITDPNPTTTQFSASLNGSLSNQDGFYNGKTLLFTSGQLTSQSQTIQNYLGASRTFGCARGYVFGPTTS